MTEAAAVPGHVTPEALRHVMAELATGVAVITCVQDRHDHAMTANSFTSVSLEPPLVLFCVDDDSRFAEAIAASDRWAVSILASHQAGRARWFATRGRPLVGQFDATPTHRSDISGALFVDDALAWLDCRTVARHPAGDHTIVVGEVRRVRLDDTQRDPLLYYRSHYRTLAADPTS
jgi:flavin reductase